MSIHYEYSIWDQIQENIVILSLRVEWMFSPSVDYN